MNKKFTPRESTPRKFNPYELNFLRRAGFDPQKISEENQMPVEYIAGYVEFRGEKYFVSPDVLIPRIETEELVSLALRQISQKWGSRESAHIAIADVGTGSGAIAISLALELIKENLPFTIVASDVSAAAIKIAEKNQQALLGELLNKKIPSNDNSEQQGQQFSLIESDLLDQFPNIEFDLVVANLPYIPSERIDYLDSSVKDFEPSIALDGGSSGFHLIAKFLHHLPQYLKKNGVAILEVDYTHTEEIFQPYKKMWHVKTIEDSFNRQRFVILSKK